MNLPDKLVFFCETFRVSEAGRFLAIYDVMCVGDRHLEVPVPWASTSEGSFVEGPEVYCRAAERAGFAQVTKRTRAEFSVEFFENLRGSTVVSGAAPVGLNLVMGQDAPIKIENIIKAIKVGHRASVEMVFNKS